MVFLCFFFSLVEEEISVLRVFAASVRVLSFTVTLDVLGILGTGMLDILGVVPVAS